MPGRPALEPLPLTPWQRRLVLEYLDHAEAVARGQLARCRGASLDDVVSWGLMGLVEAAGSWDGVGDFEAYSATGVRRAIRKAWAATRPWGQNRTLRAWQRRRELPGVIGADERALAALTADPHDDGGDLERAELLRVGLQALTRSQRALVEAHYLRGVAHRRLVPGLGEGGARRRLRLALARMRRALAKAA